MGCFSFLDKVTGEPINSDSFSGERCYLFLLENGNVIEMMYGNYDSYGRVFDTDMESLEWDMEWGKVCNLMFHDNEQNGIVALHEKNFSGLDKVPHTRSQGDPNQGWGEYANDANPVDKPFHKIF